MSVQAGWRLVGLEKSAGARCARIGTAGSGEPRDGRQCGPSWRSTERSSLREDISVECFSERIMEQTVKIAGFSRLKQSESLLLGFGNLGSQSAVSFRSVLG